MTTLEGVRRVLDLLAGDPKPRFKMDITSRPLGDRFFHLTINLEVNNIHTKEVDCNHPSVSLSPVRQLHGE